MLRGGDEALTREVIGSAIEVHRALGPGLLESAYEACLCHELLLREIPFERQVALPVIYKGRRVDCAYRLDLVVDGRLIVELKAVSDITDVHMAQILSHLKLSGHHTALLINFNVPLPKQGVRRILH